MGTCMSKDKKGAEAPVASSVLISSNSSASQTPKPQEAEQVPIAISNTTNVITTSSCSYEESLPIPIARPFSSPSPYLSSSSSSSSAESKEINTTDKHVVEIRLPMASPSKFKSSPGSANIAAKAIASIAREAENEDRDSGRNLEDEGRIGEGRVKNRAREDRVKGKDRDGDRARARIREEYRGRSRDDEDDEGEDHGDDDESSDGSDDNESSDGSDIDESSDDVDDYDDENELLDRPVRINPYTSMPPPSLFYISRASFSRDLAAFSRDIAALSSPFRRSPSVNEAHDLTSSALRTSSHTPLRHYNISKTRHALEEECSTRSRSLPKRFYNKFSEPSHRHSSHVSHKRSSSRDCAEKSSYMKRMGSTSIAEHAILSPRLSVRREEASGEYRVHARQAAARKGHHHHQHNASNDGDGDGDDVDEYHCLHARQTMAKKGHHHHQQEHSDDDENYHASRAYSSSNVIPNTSSRRSPLRRSSTGKVPGADQYGIYQENGSLPQMTKTSGFHKHNHVKGRPVLRERSVNCTSDLVDGGLKAPAKLQQQKLITKAKFGEGLENQDMLIIENEAYEECSFSHNHQKKMQTEDPSLYYTTKPKEMCKERYKEAPFYKESSKDRYKENSKERSKETYKESSKERPKESSSDAVSMYPGSIHDRIRSIIEALSEMNMESSTLLDIEESEAELERDIDLFNLHDLSTPKKDMKAQQARNILLKEAAMDAFARPSFYSNICSQDDLGPEFESVKKPTGLAALMAMKLTDTEADTLKIRKVLDLLSVAESEMDKDQKMVFYSQLRMVLDSVKLGSIMEKNKMQEREEDVEVLNGKCITSRANSWPRSVKDPFHSVSSLMVSTSTHIPKQTDVPETCGSSLEDTMYARNVIESDKEILGKDSSVDRVEVPGSVPHDDKRCTASYSYGFSCKANNDYGQRTVHESSNNAVDRENIIDCVVMSVTCDDQHSSPDILKSSDEDHENTSVTLTDAPATLFLSSLDACHVVDNLNMSIMNATSPTRTHQQEMQTDAKQHSEEMLEPAQLCAQALEHNEDVCNERKLTIPYETMMNSLLVKCDDGASDASSFEFRARSNVSTPRSTPSTPMISTATTPRRVGHADHRLSCDEIAEIWEALE